MNRICRSYMLPLGLIRGWERLHWPSKNYSPSVAGAMLVWLALDAGTRERFKRMAHREKLDESVVVEVRDSLKRWIKISKNDESEAQSSVG